ncbi:6984_t:CDS:2 [Dentiscutata heterogama]|uniref:6984_t:CDS:1 n=1 Tax=Dentiscutata heterogama TaxID=1316150 RepID=A0ACA9KIA4_9GLOM|nr:6984_t:CDS:2 [Dentiscutata heterogama]
MLPICSNDKLTSKLLNFKNLSEPINSLSAELLKISGSRKLNVSISDDYYNDDSPNKKTKYHE